MTRPRIAGSACIWIVALAVAMNEMLQSPMKTRATMATTSVGAPATTRSMTPKARPMMLSMAMLGRLRCATIRPPMTAPAPIAAMRAL